MFRHETNHIKVWGWSWVTGSWYLERNFAVACSEHHKPSAICSGYIEEIADISIADTSKNRQLTQSRLNIITSKRKRYVHLILGWTVCLKPANKAHNPTNFWCQDKLISHLTWTTTLLAQSQLFFFKSTHWVLNKKGQLIAKCHYCVKKPYGYVHGSDDYSPRWRRHVVGASDKWALPAHSTSHTQTSTGDVWQQRTWAASKIAALKKAATARWRSARTARCLNSSWWWTTGKYWMPWQLLFMRLSNVGHVQFMAQCALSLSWCK